MRAHAVLLLALLAGCLGEPPVETAPQAPPAEARLEGQRCAFASLAREEPRTSLAARLLPEGFELARAPSGAAALTLSFLLCEDAPWLAWSWLAVDATDAEGAPAAVVIEHAAPAGAWAAVLGEAEPAEMKDLSIERTTRALTLSAATGDGRVQLAARGGSDATPPRLAPFVVGDARVELTLRGDAVSTRALGYEAAKGTLVRDAMGAAGVGEGVYLETASATMRLTAAAR